MPQSFTKPKLTDEELAAPFTGAWGEKYPPVLSPRQLANLLGKSRKTVYDWIEKGRLDGTFRRRGKHILLWRDRALKFLLDGKEWPACKAKKTA